MHVIPLFTTIALGGAFIVSLVGRYSKRFCDLFVNIITFTLFLLSLYALLISHAQLSPLIYKVGKWFPPFGISLVLDGLTTFMLITVNFVAFMITLFSINYMEKFTARFKFYTLFLLMLAGMNGVIITGDLFNLFVFLEIASVASYALVAYGVEAEELEASFKYLIMSSVASLFILLGIAFAYSYTSTLNMADMAGILAAKGINNTMIFSGVLFIVGFSLKAAIVPFHAWLPDAHPAAPAPISACLSGILIKALGIYTLCRVIYNVLGINPVFLNLLMVLGVLSIIIGALLALGQMDFKRLLAYSSINQIGYIILGFGLNTELGILGALFHLFNHAIFKSLLFLNSGAVEYALGTRNLEDMGGIREKMPLTATSSLIASMSISGIPPFNGFFSKLLIILACVQADHYFYAFWAIMGSIVTLAYFMKLQKQTFFGVLTEKYKNIKEVPFFMQTAMALLTVLCITGGLMLLPWPKNYFLSPAKNVLTNGFNYKDINHTIERENEE